jgi:Ca2+/Na+ antiporter
MLTFLFSGLGVIMLLVLLISFLLTGEVSPTNMHLTAYGFILAGIGYIIESLKKKDETSADHLKYVLAKHNKELQEEIRSVRMMILKQEERKNRAMDSLSDQ